MNRRRNPLRAGRRIHELKHSRDLPGCVRTSANGDVSTNTPYPAWGREERRPERCQTLMGRRARSLFAASEGLPFPSPALSQIECRAHLSAQSQPPLPGQDTGPGPPTFSGSCAEREHKEVQRHRRTHGKGQGHHSGTDNRARPRILQPGNMRQYPCRFPSNLYTMRAAIPSGISSRFRGSWRIVSTRSEETLVSVVAHSPDPAKTMEDISSCHSPYSVQLKRKQIHSRVHFPRR